MTSEIVEGPCACNRAELPEVITIVDDAMRQDSDQTMLTDYPLVYLDRNLPNVRIIKVDGRVVSVVPFIPHDIVMDDCRFRIGIISATATDPVHRRKGYGLRCLRSCVERMDQTGCDLSVLWTEVPTFPFYEKGGHQAVRCQAWIFRCSARDAGLFANHGEKIVEYDPATGRYLADIRAMHEGEVCGIVRTAEEYPVLFSLPKMKTLIALREGAAVSYLVVSRATNKPGLLEAGGDPSAVETLVHRALSQLEESVRLDAHAYFTPTALGDLLTPKMPERRQPWVEGHMMVRINTIGGFIQKIAPWLKKRNAGARREFSIHVTDAGERISFRFSEAGIELGGEKFDEHLEMSRQELTSVIFGPHPERPVTVPDITADLFPFYFPIPILDHS